MKDELLIIGDIAGNFKALQQLISQAPQNVLIIALGDTVDKGSQSKKVLDFFKNNSHSLLILGNHEYMMIKTIQEIEFASSLSDLQYGNLWLQSRGTDTIESFLNCKIVNTTSIIARLREFRTMFIGEGYLEFLLSSPIIYYQHDLMLTHSPSSLKWLPKYLKRNCDKKQCSLLGIDPTTSIPWLHKFDIHSQERVPFQVTEPFPIEYPDFLFSRKNPVPVKKRTHIFGHMSRWGYRKFTSEKHEGFANLCLDTSKSGFLTGILWPSRTILTTQT